MSRPSYRLPQLEVINRRLAAPHCGMPAGPFPLNRQQRRQVARNMQRLQLAARIKGGAGG